MAADSSGAVFRGRALGRAMTCDWSQLHLKNDSSDSSRCGRRRSFLSDAHKQSFAEAVTLRSVPTKSFFFYRFPATGNLQNVKVFQDKNKDHGVGSNRPFEPEQT